MVTQTIKRWLNKLFAWWPWKRSPESDYSQEIGSLNTGTAQDGMRWTPIDGPVPQPGVMSIAVEQGEDNIEPGRLANEERFVQPTAPMAAGEGEAARISPRETTSRDKITSDDASSTSSPSPTFEQQLAFLQYLVKRGIVNEGFAKGQVPKQYKKKYEQQ